MSERGSVKMTWCPECDGTIALSRKLRLGEHIECPECGAFLEVISLNPFELDYALDDEDWEEEDEVEEDWEEEV
jgi:alpha-aminoadipate carrier protein LysW